MSTYISRLEELARRLKVMKCPVAPWMLICKIVRWLPTEYRHFATRTFSNLRTRLIIEEERLGLLSTDSGSALAAKKDKKKEKSAKKSAPPTFKCYKCGGIGHKRIDRRSEKSKDDSALLCSSGFNVESSGALVCASGENDYSDEFVADSGATDHMCHDKSVFETMLDCSRRIKLANGESINASGRGTVKVRCYNGQNWIDREMLNVLYVPKLKYNLFSMTKGAGSWI